MRMNFGVNSSNVKLLGRTKVVNGMRYIDYSCSGIEFEFMGTSASVVLCSDSSKWDKQFKACVAVFIDNEDEPRSRIELNSNEDTYKLYESDEPRLVRVKLLKMSEAAFGKVAIKNIIIDGEWIRPVKGKDRRIEFIGDSITCGYGNEGVNGKDTFATSSENPWEAYASKTARYFDADFNCVSWSGIGVVSSWTDDGAKNAGWLMPMLYKYTDAAIDNDMKKKDFEVWNNSNFVPDLIIINLGTNDASYTKNMNDRVNEFIDEYYKFLKQVRQRNIDIPIICTLGAMGQDLCPAVEKAVSKFKADTGDNKIFTMFYDLQLTEDGIGIDNHPSLKTHDKMSKQLISKVKEVMNWK